MGKNAIQALRLSLFGAMQLAFLIAPPVIAQAERGTEAGVSGPSSEAAIRELLSRARAAGDTSGEAVELEELGNLLRSSGKVAEAAEAYQDAARVWAHAREALREFIARHYAGLALTAAGSFSAKIGANRHPISVESGR
jgi:hypothetical protein